MDLKVGFTHLAHTHKPNFCSQLIHKILAIIIISGTGFASCRRNGSLDDF